MTINICIPSYKRSNDVKTLDSIPLTHKDNTYLYVRKEEFDEYSSHYGHRCNVIPLTNVTNIGETRQKIIEHQYGNRIYVLDDDISIHKAYIDHLGWVRCEKQNVAQDNSFTELLTAIDNLIDIGALHGGLRNSIYGLNHNPSHSAYRPSQQPYFVNGYTFTNQWFDLSRLPLSIFVYKDWVVLEDTAQWCNLVANGYDSARLSTFQINTVFDGNTGGVWETRTLDVWNSSAKSLKEKFPEYITLVIGKYSLKMIDSDGRSHLAVKPRVKESHYMRMKKINPSYTPLVDPNRPRKC